MAQRLSLTSIIAEATADPLVVELRPGTEIAIMPPSAIGPERLDRALGYTEEFARVTADGSTATDREVLRTCSLVLPLVMSEDDYATWVQADPPMPAFQALLDAISTFYAGAGSLGEGPGSPA